MKKNKKIVGILVCILFFGASFVPFIPVENAKADFIIWNKGDMNNCVSDSEHQDYSPWIEGIEYIPYEGQKDIVNKPGVVYYEPDRVIIGTNDHNVLYWVVEVLQCTLLERITDTDPDSYLFELREDLTIEQFTEFLEGKVYYEYIEANAMCTNFFIPNDPSYPEQWNLKMIGCEKAWDKTRGGRDAVIAILDTGFYYDHPDKPNHNAHGRDYVDNDWDPEDENGHGTHCAGIAAAAINNYRGIAGISNSYILTVRVLDENGYGFIWDIAKAIIWACDNDMVNADIISMSLGAYLGPIRESVFKSACDYAYYFRDTLVVAASGNDESDSPGHPACYGSVIAVGAVDKNSKRAYFSNCGVELVAPGVDILSLKRGGGYIKYSGTSMACPHVAGVAGLVYAKLKAEGKNPASWDVREILQKTAIDIGSEYEYGYGLVNAEGALKSSSRHYDRYSSLFLDFLQNHPKLFPILQIFLNRVGLV